MNEGLGSLPFPFLVFILGVALLGLQSLAMWRYKRTETAVELATLSIIALDKRLESVASKDALTNMGDRFQGLLAAERKEAHALIADLRERVRVLESNA